jgi:hypothetical protein
MYPLPKSQEFRVPFLLWIRSAVSHDADNNGQISNNTKRSSTSRHKETVNNEHYTDRHLAANFGDHSRSLTSEEWRAAGRHVLLQLSHPLLCSVWLWCVSCRSGKRNTNLLHYSVNNLRSLLHLSMNCQYFWLLKAKSYGKNWSPIFLW